MKARNDGRILSLFPKNIKMRKESVVRTVVCEGSARFRPRAGHSGEKEGLSAFRPYLPRKFVRKPLYKFPPGC